MNPLQLLQLLRKYLNLQQLLAENPDVCKKDIEGLLQRLAALLDSADAEQHDTVIVEADGASRGNPGPAGIGGLILTPDGKKLSEFHKYIGRATNNVAEYEAVREGVRLARKRGAKHVIIRADSDLLIRQLKGEYRVKSRNLIPLRVQLAAELRQFDSWEAEVVTRRANTRADNLANLAIEEKVHKPEA